jgi:glutamyl-Q tRNA(Asp) synthetase
VTDITRFAPSPTGRLHLGHAYSALFAASRGARFLLRIEDIDLTRCKPEFEQGIFEDLGWLGLKWEKPVRRQSEHFPDYARALDKLQEMELLYPCFCSRKEIQESATAPHGPEGAIYPGACRNLSEEERTAKIKQGLPYAFRLDMEKALAAVKGPLYWTDRGLGRQKATPEILGDVVLARKDVMASYHLSVTLDDNLQGVTLVTRGEDLLYATHLHRLLQELLQLNVPEWHHHEMLLDHEGKRFAKRNLSVTLQHLREVEKKTPAEIMDMIGLRL